MGYSRTPKAIEKVKELLDEMVDSDKSIEWIFDNPKKVSYSLWNAIRFAVKSKKEEYVQYSTLTNKFKIRVIEPNIVKAEIREELPYTPSGIIIRDVSDIVEVLAIAIESKKKTMIFPDVEYDKLTNSDFSILSNWCKNNSYNYKNDSNRLVLSILVRC